MIPDAANGPLDARQVEQVALARQRGKKLRTAVGVATFNVWALAVFAVLSAVVDLFGWIGLALALILGAFAWNEMRGRDALRRFDPRGLRILVTNQLALMALLVAYAGWQLYWTLTETSLYRATLQENAELLDALGGPATTDALASMEPLARTLSIAIYTGLIVGVVLFQGGNAVYYGSRRKHLEAYLRDTPGWVVELLRRV